MNAASATPRLTGHIQRIDQQPGDHIVAATRSRVPVRPVIPVPVLRHRALAGQRL
jgi:hypothetical protein